MLHEGEPESVTAGGSGRILGVNPLHQVFSWHNVGPFHRHTLVIETGNVTGLNSVRSLKFFLNFVVIIEGEACEYPFEKLAAERAGFLHSDLFQNPIHRVGRGFNIDSISRGFTIRVVQVNNVVGGVDPVLFCRGRLAAQLGKPESSSEGGKGRKTCKFPEAFTFRWRNHCAHRVPNFPGFYREDEADRCKKDSLRDYPSANTY